MTKKYIYIIILICLFVQSCKKIFNEDVNSFTYHLRDNIYLDQSTKSILFKEKIGENSFIIKNVIMDKIDSIYINENKTVIYILNSQNEYIQVKPNLKIEKLEKRPNVDFNSILSYHD